MDLTIKYLLETYGVKVLSSLVIAYVIYCILKSTVNKFIDHKLEEIILSSEFTNQRNLQIDNFYRDISGEKLLNLFNNWLEMLVDIDSYTKKASGKNGEKYINSLLKETILYGSNETIIKASIFQQFNYKNSDKYNSQEDIENNNCHIFAGMYLIAYLILSIRKDFTGNENLDPDYLIELKMKDFQENEDVFSKAKKEANEYLKLGGFE